MDATPPSAIDTLEASLRGRLRELRGDASLRAWSDFLEAEAGYSVSPNTIRSYEPAGDEEKERTIPAHYILAVGVATGRNPFWILTGTGSEYWEADKEGQSGAVLAAAQVLENIVEMLRAGAIPSSFVEQGLPPGPAREIGEALEALMKAASRRHGG